MSANGPLLESEAWKEYAELMNERNCTDKPVELIISHKGYHEEFFGKMMRVAREELEDVAVEVWKTLPMRDDPMKVQVFLGKGETLLTHMDDVKFRDTNYGSRIVSLLSAGAAAALDALLIAFLMLGMGVDFDPMNPLFLVALTACISVAATALFFGSTRFCKKIDLECCDPDGEQGDVHVCVVIHSSVAPVTEQVGALVLMKPLFEKAQEALRRNLSRQIDVKDVTIAHLENQLKRIDVDMASSQARFLNRLMAWNRAGRSPADAWRRYAGIGLLAVAVLAAAAIALLIKG